MLHAGMTISGLNWAKKHKRSFDRIISVCDPMTRPEKTLQFHQHPRPDHITLRFADLDTPADAPFTDYNSARLATEQDVARALAFDVADQRLLVHCHVGISRSTSIAYAVLCQRAGPGREQEAFQALLELQPDAVPNLHVVGLADGLLQREGAMLAPVFAHEASRPQCAERRASNREAYHSHFRFSGGAERLR